MKKTELKSLIREEIKKTINEGSVEDKVADLYAYAGIKTSYDAKMVERYGNATVQKAIEMAPKILAFQKKMQEMVKAIKTSPEGKMLMAMAKAHKQYSGDSMGLGTTGPVSVGDVFNL